MTDQDVMALYLGLETVRKDGEFDAQQQEWFDNFCANTSDDPMARYRRLSKALAQVNAFIENPYPKFLVSTVPNTIRWRDVLKKYVEEVLAKEVAS